ncbi:MAG: DUF192 domain-containing protein [archaeon]
MKEKIPKLLSISRLVSSLPVVLLAYFGSNWFILVYLIALLTDILDGFFARRLNMATKEGERLDIIADNFLAVSLIIGIYFMKPGLILYFSKYFAFIIVFFIIMQFIAFNKLNKPLFMTTLAGKLAAILFPVAFLSAYFYGIGVFVYLYFFMQLYNLIDKLSMQLNARLSKIMVALMTIILLAFVYIIPSETVCFENRCIDAKIARTVEERQIGLMFKEDLNEDEGMLFIFESSGVYGFWMKNMKISIDMIFLDKNKKIITIVRNANPCESEPCDIFRPDSDSKYVVETAAGFSDKYGLEIGDSVLFDVR